MAENFSIENDFIRKITKIIEENISNEQFGVSELAGKTGMSRSNLLRKIKKLTKISASKFIRQVRLQKAMEILKQSSLNVSEVSYDVGFSSTSYFIKCFREYYGYPPGEVGKRNINENDYTQTIKSGNQRKIISIISIVFAIVIAALLLIVLQPFSFRQKVSEKSIAVLPFINDSNDSTNVHIINGLMESILNNLQKIEDLRVISRTSVEKYRNAPKSIPEIARELNVNYFVEGSGQKIGDQILMNVQLIDASSDKHLWAEQYSRKVKDIFKLQQEVAKEIAGRIEAIITPEEEEQIDKIPTNDLIAYDYYLKGLDLMNEGNREGLEEAIQWFKKAINQDNEFALAYAYLAISYYYMDVFQTEKKYLDQLNLNADQALLFDPKLPQSLVAKALFYINNREYEQAIPFLEKALEYNPNSARVINVLADFYANIIPNTAKYLEYALKGIRLDIASQDSVTASYTFLHVSNAFIQSGFVEEAEKYINKSLDYNPQNLYSEYVRAYIMFAKNRDLKKTKDLLIKTLKKDTTRLDILQEVAKIHYYLRDYQGAYKYYKHFLDRKKSMNLDIYRYENAKIGVVFDKVGLKQDSEKLFEDYLIYAENDESVYQPVSLAVYYSYTGESQKALEQLKLFSEEDNFFYWIILFLNIDPLIDNIRDLPEFKRIFNDIETKFWNNHNKVRTRLEEEGLI